MNREPQSCPDCWVWSVRCTVKLTHLFSLYPTRTLGIFQVAKHCSAKACVYQRPGRIRDLSKITKLVNSQTRPKCQGFFHHTSPSHCLAKASKWCCSQRVREKYNKQIFHPPLLTCFVIQISAQKLSAQRFALATQSKVATSHSTGFNPIHLVLVFSFWELNSVLKKYLASFFAFYLYPTRR